MSAETTDVCGGDLHYFSESISSQKLLENISECKFGQCCFFKPFSSIIEFSSKAGKF